METTLPNLNGPTDVSCEHIEQRSNREHFDKLVIKIDLFVVENIHTSQDTSQDTVHLSPIPTRNDGHNEKVSDVVSDRRFV